MLPIKKKFFLVVFIDAQKIVIDVGCVNIVTLNCINCTSFIEKVIFAL